MKQGEESELSVKEPEILKTAEYELMLKLIDKGLWRTVNLARALHVDDDTVTAWKKTARVIKAHQDTILKFVGRRKDVELTLSELEVETPKDPTLIQVNNYQQMTDGQLRELIATKTKQLGVVVDATGVREPEETESAQLPETAPETI